MPNSVLLQQRNFRLPDALDVLQHRPTERISLNHPMNGHFGSRLTTVGDVSRWVPPQDRDVWWGVNPISPSVARGRGTEADVTRVRAVWADLDVKDGSLASMERCYAVVEVLSRWVGSEPSVLIESGHGLQPLWRVRSSRTQPNRVAEHWQLDGSAGEMWPLQRWRELCAGWGGLVAAAADHVQAGARVDSVFDLSHILRCPGTVNHKQIDRPVAVRTALNPAAPGLTRLGIVNAVAERAIVVAPTAPTMRSVPTAPREAWEWVHAQHGADAVWDEMSPAMQTLVMYPGLVELIAQGTEDDPSAHAAMTKRVLAVVLAATEGRTGLALALEMIRQAYLEVMDRRRAGELPGEARTESVATADFYRAVRGAVSKARARPVLSVEERAYGTSPLRVTLAARG
ncbi:hypothetical protein QE449_003326 [Rhodococcus sp. SORGH_AS303]|nr:hypothetical protein [Rhodococcus sp. SORGH_AS_0303]